MNPLLTGHRVPLRANPLELSQSRGLRSGATAGEHAAWIARQHHQRERTRALIGAHSLSKNFDLRG